MRLTMDVPKVSRTQRIAMALVATCALLGGAMTAAALSFDVTPQDGAAGAGQEKVYKVGDGVTPPVLVHAVDAEFTKKGEGCQVSGRLCGLAVVDAHGMPRTSIRYEAGHGAWTRRPSKLCVNISSNRQTRRQTRGGGDQHRSELPPLLTAAWAVAVARRRFRHRRLIAWGRDERCDCGVVCEGAALWIVCRSGGGGGRGAGRGRGGGAAPDCEGAGERHALWQHGRSAVHPRCGWRRAARRWDAGVLRRVASAVRHLCGARGDECGAVCAAAGRSGCVDRGGNCKSGDVIMGGAPDAGAVSCGRECADTGRDRRGGTACSADCEAAGCAAGGGSGKKSARRWRLRRNWARMR